MIAGVLGVYGLFNMQARSRRADDDSVSANLINNLKSTVDQMKEQNAIQAVKLEQTTKELHQMQGRNTVLEQLFNGQEGSIMAFLKQAPALVKITEENNAMAKRNADDIGKLTKAVELLVGVLKPGSSITVNAGPGSSSAAA